MYFMKNKNKKDNLTRKPQFTLFSHQGAAHTNVLHQQVAQEQKES